jgi:hypothetical protein
VCPRPRSRPASRGTAGHRLIRRYRGQSPSSGWWRRTGRPIVAEGENVMGHSVYDPGSKDRQPWNAGRKPGAKRPLKPRQVWAIRFWLDHERRLRDRALFDLAIDSKLRGCDVVKVKIGDVIGGGRIRSRAIMGNLGPRYSLYAVPTGFAPTAAAGRQGLQKLSTGTWRHGRGPMIRRQRCSERRTDSGGAVVPARRSTISVPPPA